jgi:hypothetical protein
MDRRPTVEARPPALIDTIVRLSIPVPCREHVIGDLWERYRTSGSFALDAMRTVPFIVVSQVRRTSMFGSLVIHAFVLVVGFAAGAGSLKSAIAPVTAALLGFVLRDAYKSTISLSGRQVLRDLAVVAGFVAASQVVVAVVAPSLVLLSFRALVGGTISFGMIFFLRLQNPGFGSPQPRQVLAQAPASLDMLVNEVRMHERLGLRAIRIEMGAGIVLAVFFLVPSFNATNWALRVGWLLASLYGLYVAAVVSRHRPRRMPDALGFDASLQFYRAALERQHRMIQTMWLWYLMPFTPAIAFIMLGATLVAAERGRPLWPGVVFVAVMAAIGLVVHNGSQDMARKLRLRIDTLASARERAQ